MRAREILTIKGQALFTIGPEQTLKEAVTAMNAENVGSLVVFEHGHMVGLLTFRQVLQATARDGATWESATVRSAMLTEPVVAEANMELNDLRHMMVNNRQRYIPIMDDTVLLGVVTFYDIARAVLEEQRFETRMLKNYIKNWPEQENLED